MVLRFAAFDHGCRLDQLACVRNLQTTVLKDAHCADVEIWISAHVKSCSELESSCRGLYRSRCCNRIVIFYQRRLRTAAVAPYLNNKKSETSSVCYCAHMSKRKATSNTRPAKVSSVTKFVCISAMCTWEESVNHSGIAGGSDNGATARPPY